MPEELSKMQIRAIILKTLSKYRKLKNPLSEQIALDIEQFRAIDDKEQIAKTLFKEIASSELGEYINICAIILIESIENDVFEKCALDFLKDKNNTDEKKFFVISLIKQKGIYFDYDNIEDYIESPDTIAQNGVKGFLLNTLDDAEAQIDLLDFYLNIPEDEQIFLLNSLSKEDEIDSVAFVMGMISKLSIEDNKLNIIINALLEFDTPYAIEGLDYISKNYKIDLKQRQKLKNKIKKLKEKYPNFENNALIKNSSVNNSYISFVDGNSNFALILSRKNKEGLIDAIFLTININCGISACMGFGCISPSNYKTVLLRLFPDMLPVKINPMALKAIYKYYLSINEKTGTELPYELIVWSKLLDDIEDINYNFKDFIISKLDTTNLNEEKVKKFLLTRTNDNWFFEYGQNEAIDKIIDEIEKKHITQYDEIEKIIAQYIDEDFINNDKFTDEIIQRLIMQSYVLKLANLKMSSYSAYSLCFKDKYYKMFVNFLILKSIYQHFINMKEELSKKDNIFRKDNKYSFNSAEIENIAAQIEEEWKLKKE